MANSYPDYYSTFGKTVVIDRAVLTSYLRDASGYPKAVEHESGTAYMTIYGLALHSYIATQPDIVVFRLHDGSLLAATKEMMDGWQPEKTATYQKCFIHRVKYMMPLPFLPQEIPNPVDEMVA